MPHRAAELAAFLAIDEYLSDGMTLARTIEAHWPGRRSGIRFGVEARGKTHVWRLRRRA